jgi:hypothetical protein
VLDQAVTCLSTTWKPTGLVIVATLAWICCYEGNSFRRVGLQVRKCEAEDPALRLEEFGGDGGEGIPTGNPRRAGWRSRV